MKRVAVLSKLGCQNSKIMRGYAREGQERRDATENRKVKRPQNARNNTRRKQVARSLPSELEAQALANGQADRLQQALADDCLHQDEREKADLRRKQAASVEII